MEVLSSTKVINPLTKKPIEKYSRTWWHLLPVLGAEKQSTLEIVSPSIPKIDLVKNLNGKIPFHDGLRAGVILYSYQEPYLYFGFGVDRQFRELTDFGGGLKRKESISECALRELCEETNGIMCNITESDLENSIAIYDKYTIIIFLQVHQDPDDISIAFNEVLRLKGNVDKAEVSEIEWVTYTELYSVINELEYYKSLGVKPFIYSRTLELISYTIEKYALDTYLIKKINKKVEPNILEQIEIIKTIYKKVETKLVIEKEFLFVIDQLPCSYHRLLLDILNQHYHITYLFKGKFIAYNSGSRIKCETRYKIQNK